MRNFLKKHTRALSLISAALFGFGLAVSNVALGAVCLILALLLDFAYCKLSAPADPPTA